MFKILNNLITGVARGLRPKKQYTPVKLAQNRAYGGQN